jgi:hypothetical protein
VLLDEAGDRWRVADCAHPVERRFESWIDPGRGVIFVLEVLGSSSGALRTETQYLEENLRGPWEAEIKWKYFCTLFPLLAALTKEVEIEWKDLSTSESTITNNNATCGF